MNTNSLPPEKSRPLKKARKSSALRVTPASPHLQTATPLRPLGILFSHIPSPFAASNKGSSTQRTSVQKNKSPNIFAKSANATLERPLGTLIAPQGTHVQQNDAPLPYKQVRSNISSQKSKLDNGKDLPLRFSAEEMTFDENQKTVIAKGNVKVRNGQRTIVADQNSYNQERDVVTARGGEVHYLTLHTH